MTAGRRLPLLALVAAACGDRGGPSAPSEESAVATLVRADPAGRTVVATVDGEPVYDDCVARQAAATGTDARAAVAQCIEFELLAQEALRRGLAGDPEVAAARRTEMVRALVDADYTTTMDEPSDIPEGDLRTLWNKTIQHLYNKPERRRATYCRVPSAARKRGKPADDFSRDLAHRIHRSMAGRAWKGDQFAEQCLAASGGHKVELPPRPLPPFAADGRFAGGQNVREFTDAAYSVPVGRPTEPVRSRWGWDIVLTTEILPPQSRSFEDAEAEVRAKLLRDPDTSEYRVTKFAQWVRTRLAGANVEVFPEALRADSELLP